MKDPIDSLPLKDLADIRKIPPRVLTARSGDAFVEGTRKDGRKMLVKAPPKRPPVKGG